MNDITFETTSHRMWSYMSGNHVNMTLGTMSDHGLDKNYYILNDEEMIPTDEMFVELQIRLKDLFATLGPEHIHRCVRQQSLRDLLGPRFNWVRHT